MAGVTVVQMPLRDEGIEVWRPVLCWALGEQLFLVDFQTVPGTEDWTFLPGQVVRCAPRRFAGGDVLLAANSAVPPEPETVQSWLELHDSVLLWPGDARADVEVSVEGYVHRWETRAGVRFGLGFTQPVAFRFSGVPSVRARPAARIAISDGSLVVPGETLANLIPLPFGVTGSVLLSLLLSDGTTFEVAADGCSVSATGEGRFVEVLPANLHPEPA